MRLMKRMKKKADKKPMSVEGSAAKPRLDRPMRRADGGVTLSKEREDYAKQKEADMRAIGAHGGGAGLATGMLLGLVPALKGFKKGAAATAAMGAGTETAKSLNDHRMARIEAERARSGKVEEGKEDRKRGGKVCK